MFFESPLFETHSGTFEIIFVKIKLDMDIISDMLVRIQNAYRAGHETVLIPHSKLKAALADVLEKQKFIGKTEKKGKKVRKFIEVALKYREETPAMSGFKRISKPSRRMYIDAKGLFAKKRSRGIMIISTSKGLMTNHEAKKAGVGGEVMAEIW
jgi:small subunit ribosomal protein S8